MRTRTAVLVFACSLIVLTIAWLAGGPAAPGWAASPAWIDLGGPYGGPAHALALNPEFPADSTVLAGGAADLGHASFGGLGIFRSLDGGLTWPDRGGPSHGAVFDVAYSPTWTADGFALAGLWDGAWVTNDRGATWRQVSSLETGGPAFVASVAVSSEPGGGRTLLAGGSYGGIYRSQDDGLTWHAANPPISVRSLRFNPVRPSVALAAAANGLWRSADGGLAWTQVTTSTQVFDVAFTADGSAAYGTFDDHIWRSADDGLTWQAMPGLSAPYLDRIGLSDDGAGFFVAARQTLYRYDVTAAAFVTVTTNLRTNSYLRLAPSPTFGADQMLLVGTYDGVWISHDGGATFIHADGFVRLPLRSLVAASSDLANGELFAGGEYGLWRRAGGFWQPVNVGLGAPLSSVTTDVALSPAYASDGTLFVTQGSTVSIGASLYRSTDRGATWERLKGAASMSQIELAPGFPGDVRAWLLADQRVLDSADGGVTWNARPFWLESRTARVLALSPDFATDQTLYAAGDDFYRSQDGGLTWSAPATGLPIGDVPPAMQPRRLTIAPDGQIFLTLYLYDPAEGYARHDQLWTSADRGATWSRVAAAPDLPMAALAIGPGALSGDVLYLSVFDDNEFDDRVVAPDLYASGDRGATWRNLGAVPHGPAQVLTTAAGTPGQLIAGSQGAWLLDTAAAPTATPDPCRELLTNRSFEAEGVWRIPVTAYSAARTTERASVGYWSMRTGIVDSTANVRSYSDFSQDVTLPANGTLALGFDRWSTAGATAGASSTAPAALLAATTLDAFRQALTTVAGDLHYAMVIEPPDGTIHFLYVRLDGEESWVAEHFDLSAYASKQVRLQFGTYNDGAGAVAAQTFDAFSLAACSGPPSTPTATPPVEPRGWLPYVSRDDAGTIPPLPGGADAAP